MMHYWRQAIAWLNRHNRTRAVVWLAILWTIVLGLMLQNPHVPHGYHFLYVTPFLVLALSGTSKLVWMSVQAPGPRGTDPWWAFWRWMPMPVIAIALWVLPITVYGYMVWAYFSGRWDPPGWPLDIARLLLTIAGSVVWTTMCDLIWRWFHAQEDA